MKFNQFILENIGNSQLTNLIGELYTLWESTECGEKCIVEDTETSNTSEDGKAVLDVNDLSEDQLEQLANTMPQSVKDAYDAKVASNKANTELQDEINTINSSNTAE